VGACAVRNAWLEAAEASQHVLDRTTIQDLLQQQVSIRAHRLNSPARECSLPTSVTHH